MNVHRTHEDITEYCSNLTFIIITNVFPIYPVSIACDGEITPTYEGGITPTFCETVRLYDTMSCIINT